MKDEMLGECYSFCIKAFTAADCYILPPISMCKASLRVCYTSCVLDKAHCHTCYYLSGAAAMQAIVSEPTGSLCSSIVICSCRPAERSGQHSAWEVWALAGQLQGREGPKHWLIFNKL